MTRAAAAVAVPRATRTRRRHDGRRAAAVRQDDLRRVESRGVECLAETDDVVSGAPRALVPDADCGAEGGKGGMEGDGTVSTRPAPCQHLL